MLTLTVDWFLLIYVIPVLSIAGIGFLFTGLVRSGCYWPIRWAIALSTLSVLLLRPSVDLFAVGLSGFCTLEAYWAFWGDRSESPRNEERVPYRFSLASLCFCTVIVAVVAAVYRISPRDFSIEAIGFGCVSGTVLCATTIFKKQTKRLENVSDMAGDMAAENNVSIWRRCRPILIGGMVAVFAAGVVSWLIPKWPIYDSGSTNNAGTSYFERWLLWAATFSTAMIVYAVLDRASQYFWNRLQLLDTQANYLRCSQELFCTRHGALFLLLFVGVNGVPLALIAGMVWPTRRPVVDPRSLSNYRDFAETCISIVPQSSEYAPVDGPPSAQLLEWVQSEPEKVDKVLSQLHSPMSFVDFRTPSERETAPLLGLMKQYGAVRSVLAVKLNEAKPMVEDFQLCTDVLQWVAQLRTGSVFHVYMGREIERLAFRRLLYLWPQMTRDQQVMVRKRVVETLSDRSSLEEHTRNELLRLRFIEPWQRHVGGMVRCALGHELIQRRGYENCEIPLRQFFLSIAVIEWEQRHGKLPEGLASLAQFEWIKPEFLLDPWSPSAAEFRYHVLDNGNKPSSVEFEIYSVGPNGVDDGGTLQQVLIRIDDVGLR